MSHQTTMNKRPLHEIYNKSKVHSCPHCGGEHLNNQLLHKECIKKELAKHTTIYSESVMAELHNVGSDDPDAIQGW